MKLKRNDNVKIIIGKNKGKEGKVIQSFPRDGKVVIEGVNTMVKNLKSRSRGEKGQKIEFYAPINVSNVKFICPKCSRPVRLKYKLIKKEGEDKAKKYRVCGKCQDVV